MKPLKADCVVLITCRSFSPLTTWGIPTTVYQNNIYTFVHEWDCVLYSVDCIQDLNCNTL